MAAVVNESWRAGGLPSQAPPPVEPMDAWQSIENGLVALDGASVLLSTRSRSVYPSFVSLPCASARVFVYVLLCVLCVYYLNFILHSPLVLLTAVSIIPRFSIDFDIPSNVQLELSQ